MWAREKHIAFRGWVIDIFGISVVGILLLMLLMLSPYVRRLRDLSFCPKTNHSPSLNFSVEKGNNNSYPWEITRFSSVH